MLDPTHDRNSGIGASEAAVIVGLSPWKTPLQLFRDKRGMSERGKVTIPQRAGNALEPIVIEELEDRLGQRVTNRQDRILDQANSWRWATIDGMVGDKLVEAKTAASADEWGEEGTDQIPKHYIVQVQHSFACTGLDFAYVPVLFGTRDFKVYEVTRNDDIIAALTQQEKEFWRRVQENDPPPLTDANDVKLRWPVDNGTSVTATEDVISHLLQLKSYKTTIKEADAAAEELEAAIKTHISDASQLVDSEGKVLATWKKAKDGNKFDTDAFKEDHADLWFKYQRPTTGSRRFLVK